MLYIDSADRAAVERLLDTGLFAGVTTHPTILLRAGLGAADAPAVHAWAVAAGAGTVYLQAVGAGADDLAAHGLRLRDLGDDVVVKLPATAPGLTAARRLTGRGVPVLLTAVYHASQAVLADAAGAAGIAPYVGRMDDLGLDGVAQTRALHEALTASGRGCRVLAASVRTLDQAAALSAAGIPDLTLSVPLCNALLDQGASVAAAAQFELDAAGPGH